MAIRSGFFNSVNGDRKYDANRFAEYFASFIGNGVFPDPSDGLQVVANDDMTVTVKAGKCWINGYIMINDDDYILQLEPADGVLNRIDRVVARYDTTDREIRLEVKKGAFASQPVAPVLQRDADAYELALADIYVGAGIVKIINITDLRNNKDLCGRVDSLIAGDVQSIADALDAHMSEIATQTELGHIKLSDIPSPTIATQAEAEEGTNNTKFMTPLRTHQAIDSKVRIIDNRVEIFIDGEWLTFIHLPDDESGSPGPTRLIAGDWLAGFFGEVSASELISGDALASLVGISQGTSQHSTAGWLKFAWQGKILFVAKKAFRYSVSWDHINSANAVYGDKTVEIGGLTYKVRLLKGSNKDPAGARDGAICHGSEWNRLMLPIHQEAINKDWAYPDNVEDDIPVWAHNLGTGTQGRYTDVDLLIHYDHGGGSRSWCQEVAEDAANRVNRGFRGVSHSYSYSSSDVTGYNGWRPCLELVP